MTNPKLENGISKSVWLQFVVAVTVSLLLIWYLWDDGKPYKIEHVCTMSVPSQHAGAALIGKLFVPYSYTADDCVLWRTVKVPKQFPRKLKPTDPR